MKETRNSDKFQRESLRKSLSKQEAISPEAGVDLSEFGRSAAIRIYKRRWLILLLYNMFVFGSQMQWLQYTVVVNDVVEFFKVSSMAVKATAMIWTLSFIVLLYPLIWLIHKKGMRFVLVIAAASICLGTWIKYFAISPDQFILILVGQCFVGIWQLTMISLPAKLASNWFGPDEVATATALGFGGTVFGLALSNVFGPIIVENHNELGDIGKDLNHYVLPLGFYSSCVLFLVYFFFSEEPKVPPGKATALQRLCVADDFQFFTQILRLLKNRNYLLLWNAHGLIVGVMIFVRVSLSALYMLRFQNGEMDIRRMELLFILCGYAGAIIFARILDKFKSFKLILIGLYVANILTILCAAVSMYFGIRLAVYISVATYGLFASAYYTTSFETCAELTYPEPVTICVTILNLANLVYSVIFITCLDKLMAAYSDVAVYAFLIAVLIIGCILSCITRDERRRQAAGKL